MEEIVPDVVGWNDDDSPQLRSVIAWDIEARDASDVLRSLPHDLPHLKRVKRQGTRLLVLAHGEGLKVDVPIAPPTTEAQRDKGNEFWPMLKITKRADPTRERVAMRVREHAERVMEDARSEGCASGGGVLVAPDGRITRASPDDHPLMHPTLVCIDANAKYHLQHKTDEYLCTGFDLILSDEPCVMCAMALVHARIATVAFRRTREDGGLSKVKVHTLRSLNHRYRAFRFDAPPS